MGKKVVVTAGMANHFKKTAITSCSECGVHIPSYQGAYPQTCPNCGTELIYEHPKSVDVIKLINSLHKGD